MPSISSNIKTRINTLLNELKTATVLGEVVLDDFKISGLFDRDFAAFPAAVLTGPAIEGGYLTNRENLRVYTFEIVIITKAEDIASATAIEDLMETIMDKFDNDPTLNGNSDGGMEPSVSAPAPITARGKSFVVFSVVLKAKASKSLTF